MSAAKKRNVGRDDERNLAEVFGDFEEADEAGCAKAVEIEAEIDDVEEEENSSSELEIPLDRPKQMKDIRAGDFGILHGVPIEYDGLVVIVRETYDDAKRLTVETLQCDDCKVINVKSKKCHVYADSQFQKCDKVGALLKYRFDKFELKVKKQGKRAKILALNVTYPKRRQVAQFSLASKNPVEAFFGLMKLMQIAVAGQIDTEDKNQVCIKKVACLRQAQDWLLKSCCEASPWPPSSVRLTRVG